MLAGAAAVTLAWVTPAPAAEALSPWWQATTEVAPTHIAPEGEGHIFVNVTNLGDASANGGAGHPVTITDTLPSDLTATGIESKASCKLATLQCTFTGSVSPYERLTITIKVTDSEPPGTVETSDNEVTVEGGGAPHGASSTQPVTVSGVPAEFGVEADQLSLYNGAGEPATEAGSHPFELTQTLVMNQMPIDGVRQPAALPKDLRFDLPPGLIGDVSAAEQCTMTNFAAIIAGSPQNLCSPRSVVGVVTVTIYEPRGGASTQKAPVFNLVPAQGEPARFGFEVLGLVPIVIDTAVRSGGDYGVVASVENATELAGLLSSQVTLWGVPGDPRHNQSRGWECLDGQSCPASELPQTPFLTLPTSCAANPAEEPVLSRLEADSWADPLSFPLSEPTAEYVWANEEGRLLGFEGCQQLPFEPAIQVRPEEAHAAPVDTGSTPTGLTVDVKVPQGPTLEPNPAGRAEADVRDTTVTLPEGVQVSPSAANGLKACSEEAVGYKSLNTTTGMQEFTAAEAACPEAAKLGTVNIKTPLLSHELEGSLYLADPAPNGEGDRNPFNSLIALYLVARDPVSGVLVKLAGEGQLNQRTGQMSTSFRNTPELPFEELQIQLFGGERASLSTPAFCGSYSASSVFDAWSGALAEPFSEAFQVTSGAHGGACPGGSLAFSPGFVAQSTGVQAGGFSPFELALERPDGQQALTGVTVHLAPGMAALLSSVSPCPEPPAGVEWSCGAESLIGHSTASSGLGDEPVSLPGEVFLTSGYDGAPFGILVRTKAEAGPFDLGYVNVRSRVEVNPETAAVTVTTDPGPHGDALPTMLKGIPVQIKALQVDVDRPGFEFNPTSCDTMSIQGTLDGSEGTATAVSSPFQVGGCGSLPFAPTLSASAGGKGSKLEGTSFDVKLTSTGLGQANIRKVDLQLPLELSTRNTTLNKACLEAVFNTNPASCDEGSIIGKATIHTPVLKSPLTGPAYLVSHGGAAFPDVEFVLKGEGVTIVLDGKTDVKAGITYSRFETAPDAPFTSFETELPAGPHSILTPNVPEKEAFSLCKQTLTMPTTITAQDGATIEQTTPIAITGCGEVKSNKTAKPTRAQLLAKALKACKTKYKHSKSKRQACEKQARKKYGPLKKPAKKAAHKTSHTSSHTSSHRP